jgi:hypothetical protein
MSYNHIADAASDSDLRRRVAACFAQQTTGTEQPEALASVHMWRIAADNDIAAAYAYGVDTNVPNPGKDEAVVTDAQILAAVEAIVAPAPVEEE